MKSWDDLQYWQTGEWQVIQEHLDDMDKAKTKYCPSRENLFAALDATPYDEVKVMIIGQDPYPNPKHATGIAFDIPKVEWPFPPTLENIFKEYVDDLHYDKPSSGSLIPWAKQGVLLWNATPSCQAFKSMSHADWPEWQLLTQEIVEECSKKGIVFVFLGSKAQQFDKFVDQKTSLVLKTSHPSPRGNLNSKTPFSGSRIFSTINTKLNERKLGAINWRL